MTDLADLSYSAFFVVNLVECYSISFSVPPAADDEIFINNRIS